MRLYKRTVFPALIVGLAIWLVHTAVSFAEIQSQEENGFLKEELKPRPAPVMNEDLQGAASGESVSGGRTEMQPEEIVRGEDQAQSAPQQEVKFSLSAKKAEETSTVRTKKVFKIEFGLIDVVIKEESKKWGTLSLDDCINIAVKNHLPLQIAEKSTKLAQLRVIEARRNMLPTVTIAFEEGNGRVNSLAYISRKQYVEGQQPIFHGGELYFTMKQAETNLQITKNDYDKTRNELILQVKKGYYTLAKTKGNLRIQKEIFKEVMRLFDMVRKQFEANVASKIEFLNVSSQASQVNYQLISAKGDVSVAELILKQAMNLDPRDMIDIGEGLEFKKVAVDFETVLSAAFLNRPEMKINALMVDYYNYGQGIAKAKGWPKIDLLGQWGLSKDEYASPDQNPTDPNAGDRKMEQQWYAGLKASMPFWGSTAEISRTMEHWPPVVSSYHTTQSDTMAYKVKLLDKLDYYSDKRLAEIDFDKARQELIKIRQDVTLEVKESCFNYEKSLIQAETASNKVRFQEKDLELNRMKRSMDEIPDSTVIESMIKLGQEKFGYLQALAECHTALATVNKAIGVEDYFKDLKK